MDLLKKTVNGVKVEVTVRDDGSFHTRVNGEWFSAFTLAELLTIIKRETRKTKIEVAVPAMLIHHLPVNQRGWVRTTDGEATPERDVTCVPITLTGIDWRNDQVKYRDAKGEMHTFGRGRQFGSREESIGKPMTPNEVKTWQALLKAKVKADDEFEKFNHKFAFPYGGADQLVKDAQAAKTDTPVEESEVPSYEDPLCPTCNKKARFARTVAGVVYWICIECKVVTKA